MSSAVTNLWRQFVQRRLWPVAILLVAALAAVPMLLADDPAPPAPAPPVPVTGADAADELAAEPIVVAAQASTKRRKVLGNAKNPFGVPAADKPANTTTSNDPVVNVQNQGDDQGSTPSGGSAPANGGTATPTAPSTPVAPTAPVALEPKPKTYALQELTVRFGSAEDAGRQSLKRLQPLPSAEEPVLIYMGLLKDGKTAVFLVDHGVEPIGDGECRPTPEQCETIRMQEGETEFLDVKDETGAVVNQYQLDLIKIHKGSTASAAKASASSKAGARLVKARPAAAAYRFNAETGSLEPRRGVLRSTVGRSAARLP